MTRLLTSITTALTVTLLWAFTTHIHHRLQVEAAQVEMRRGY